MDFGVFILMQQRGYHQSPDSILRNAIEQTVVADQAGFNTAWYAEHHFSNYSLCPSPLMMIAHCAALTRNIRLGSAVCVLPLYHPARLMAEAAFADTVSNGRLELGVGTGYQQFEFERFGVKLEDSPAIFHEFLDVLQKGFREKVFSYDGKHLNFPPTAISLRTRQAPMPPIWLATGHSETQRRAIREGYNLFVTALLGGIDKLGAIRTQLEARAAEEGTSLDKVKIGLLRCAFASDNQSEIQSFLECARYQRRVSESLKDRRAHSEDGYMVKEEAGPNDVPLDSIRAALPVGSVNQVIDRMLEEISVLRPNHIALQTQLGDFDQATMLRQMELWGTRIIPEINKALGHTAKPQLAAAGN